MINICLLICIIVFARCVYLELLLGSSRRELVFWAKVFGVLHLRELMELQEGAPFLGYNICVSYSEVMTKKIERSMISICFVNYILVFAPFVYIELPILSSLRELHFWAMNYDTKIQKSRINICFAVCIFVFAPHLDIQLPLGSSGSQFHVWARGFGLLTRSGAMKKKFRSL